MVVQIVLTEQEEAIFWDLVENEYVVAAFRAGHDPDRLSQILDFLIESLHPEVKEIIKEPFDWSALVNIRTMILHFHGKL